MTNPALEPSVSLSPLLIAVAVVFALLLGGAAALWTWYGGTVFYEMIVAGLAYCF